jgi:PPOX class probable F420-dependent enzyme
MDPGSQKHVLFTTFRRDGTPVATPVWCTPLEGGFGFWTSSGSGKAKRLAHTSRVLVQPCNGRGQPTPGTSPVEATARVVRGPECEEIKAKIIEKYGFMTKLTKFLNRVGNVVKRQDRPYADRAVIVTLTTDAA